MLHAFGKPQGCKHWNEPTCCFAYHLLATSPWLDPLPSPPHRWLRPANRQLCGALPPNLPFTVCQISGSACIPLTASNFSTDCGEPRTGTHLPPAGMPYLQLQLALQHLRPVRVSCCLEISRSSTAEDRSQPLHDAHQLDVDACPGNAGAVAADTSVVEVVIRILGYNLTPFDAPQQAALQDALAAVIPSIEAPASSPPS